MSQSLDLQDAVRKLQHDRALVANLQSSSAWKMFEAIVEREQRKVLDEMNGRHDSGYVHELVGELRGYRRVLSLLPREAKRLASELSKRGVS